MWPTYVITLTRTTGKVATTADGADLQSRRSPWTDRDARDARPRSRWCAYDRSLSSVYFAHSPFVAGQHSLTTADIVQCCWTCCARSSRLRWVPSWVDWWLIIMLLHTELRVRTVSYPFIVQSMFRVALEVKDQIYHCDLYSAMARGYLTAIGRVHYSGYAEVHSFVLCDNQVSISIVLCCSLSRY